MYNYNGGFVVSSYTKLLYMLTTLITIFAVADLWHFSSNYTKDTVNQSFDTGLNISEKIVDNSVQYIRNFDTSRNIYIV